MPQQAWSKKRERQYEHIKEGEKKRGTSTKRAKEIAARTVNKERARAGESRTSSRSSTRDMERDDLGREGLGRLETQVARFQDAALPRASLVNSSFALPFCPPAHFGDVWQRIVASLESGGRFSGQLFGDRDTWATRPEMSFQTREEAEELLRGMALERFTEVDEDGKTALGDAKHWHVFHVVARR